MKKSSFEKVHAAVTQYNVLFNALETLIEEFECTLEDSVVSQQFDDNMYYDDILTLLKLHNWNLHDYKTAEKAFIAQTV